MTRTKLCQLLLLTLACLLAAPRSAQADKLRSLIDVVGARQNQLIGYGVVVGLNGTGDDVSVPYARHSLRSLLRRLGVQVDSRQVRLKNVAAVIVTADIPPFSRSGSRIDVTVSSMGNARSLEGGVLLQTPLKGGNRQTYAAAQGALLLGGFTANAGGSSVRENATNTARIPGGALVEREIPTKFSFEGKVKLALKQPDFGTAQRIVEAVNETLGKGSAVALDGGAIEVKAPKKLEKKPVELLATLYEVEVQPAVLTRVVINERTGTIVAGGDVRLSPVAIAQGGITITVSQTRQVSQPNALATGDTRVVDQHQLDTEERVPAGMTYVDGAATLADVAQALSTFGVAPRELASILQALKAAGALNAELVVQ